MENCDTKIVSLIDTSEIKKYHKALIPVALKRAVWNIYIGECYGLAYCFAGCNGLVSQTNFACGHIIAEKNGGKLSLENLRPVCTACNSSMGTQNMNEFMEKYGLKQPVQLKRILKIQNSECCSMI